MQENNDIRGMYTDAKDRRHPIEQFVDKYKGVKNRAEIEERIRLLEIMNAEGPLHGVLHNRINELKWCIGERENSI